MQSGSQAVRQSGNQYSLDYNAAVDAAGALLSSSPRASHPDPNRLSQAWPNRAAEVPFLCHTDHLVLSLLFVMATETNAYC